jgi:hypothetical protein
VSVIVIEFSALDGIVSDPDGSGGTPAGGRGFRHGPGTGARLLPAGRPPAYLEFLPGEQAGAAVRTRHRGAAR